MATCMSFDLDRLELDGLEQVTVWWLEVVVLRAGVAWSQRLLLVSTIACS